MENEENAVEETEETPAPETKPVPKKAAPKAPKTETVTVEVEKVIPDPATEQRAKAAESALHTHRVKDVLRDVASDAKNGIRSPGAVAALIDSSKITFETDANGNETAKGVKAEMDRLKKAYPDLFFDLPGSSDGGAGNGDATGELDGNAWLRNASR